MGRPRKDDGREVVSLSLPADLAAALERHVESTGLTKAQLVRNAMSIGLILDEDLPSLARAVRIVHAHPERFTTSTKLTLRDLIDKRFYGLNDQSRLSTSDVDVLRGYLRKVGPYQIAPGGWAAGPFHTKEHGEEWQVQVNSEEFSDAQGFHVKITGVVLKPHPIELDGHLYWVYTNACMTPQAVEVFRNNVMKTWDQIPITEE